MAKLPRDTQVHAERYIETTVDTVESLQFLLDNMGVREPVALDLSLNSIDSLEQIAVKIHEGAIPPDVFPQLIDHYAFLLAQYCALVILHSAPAMWSVDALRSSYYFGQPYIDADPSEGWQRYYPLGTQRGVASEGFLSMTGKDSLKERVAGLIEARLSFEALRRDVKACIGDAPNGTMSEGEIVQRLQEKGAAPDPGAFATAYRRFPKRVAKVLRNGGDFSKNRTTGLWRCRDVPPNKSLERTRGR